MDFDDFDDDGIESGMKRIASVIRSLPYAPFDTPEFREMSSRPIQGVDLPDPRIADPSTPR